MDQRPEGVDDGCDSEAVQPQAATAEHALPHLSERRRLGQRLHAFSNMVSGTFYERTEKPLGVGLTEWRVLRAALFTPGVSQSEVASAQGLNVMNVSRAVAGLARKGLLEVGVDPSDRRRTLLTPTDLGRQLGADISAREHEMYSWIFAGLSPAEVALMDEMMSRVNAVLRAGGFPDPPPASRPWSELLARSSSSADDG